MSVRVCTHAAGTPTGLVCRVSIVYDCRVSYAVPGNSLVLRECASDLVSHYLSSLGLPLVKRKQTWQGGGKGGTGGSATYTLFVNLDFDLH